VAFQLSCAENALRAAPTPSARRVPVSCGAGSCIPAPSPSIALSLYLSIQGGRFGTAPPPVSSKAHASWRN